MIETKNLCKNYAISGQHLSVAKNINLTILKGEMVSIVGHSGSGKTTLLSLIGGLTKPDSGTILIDGIDIWAIKDDSLSEFRNRKISFIYQFASLIPTLTALENILLPTAFSTVKVDLGDKAMHLLQEVGLNDKASYYPSQLSGGQQRRVAIARAFINNPEIILADEPTGDLDEQTEQEIIALFNKINQQEATTFVMVTHNQQIASESQRTLRMTDGILTSA